MRYHHDEEWSPRRRGPSARPRPTYHEASHLACEIVPADAIVTELFREITRANTRGNARLERQGWHDLSDYLAYLTLLEHGLA